eukprot:6191710-Pleurochrysis_carterae.AAC.3
MFFHACAHSPTYARDLPCASESRRSSLRSCWCCCSSLRDSSPRRAQRRFAAWSAHAFAPDRFGVPTREEAAVVGQGCGV